MAPRHATVHGPVFHPAARARDAGLATRREHFPEPRPVGRPARRGSGRGRRGRGRGRPSSAPVRCRYGYCRRVTVMVIVPTLSEQSASTMKAVMPFWKCVPLPFTAKLFWFTVEMM